MAKIRYYPHKKPLSLLQGFRCLPPAEPPAGDYAKPKPGQFRRVRCTDTRGGLRVVARQSLTRRLTRRQEGKRWEILKTRVRVFGDDSILSFFYPFDSLKLGTRHVARTLTNPPRVGRGSTPPHLQPPPASTLLLTSPQCLSSPSLVEQSASPAGI
jgi:hypothetical protein